MLSKCSLALASAIGITMATTGVAQAQALHPNYLAYWRHVQDGSTGDYRLVAGGNFTGHGYADVAYLAGSQVMLATAPAIHTAALPIAQGLTATGLATVVAAAPAGRDGLAIATSNGLYLWTLGAAPTLLDARSWGSVSAGDVDGDGTPDLVGVDTTNSKVLVTRQVAGGWTPTSILFANQTVRSVTTVGWSGATALEIAVATDQRLWVGSYTGQAPLVNWVRSTSASLGLTSLRFGTTQGLAWLAKSPTGVGTLMTLRPGEPTEYLAVDTLSPATITAGDWQSDGYDDLVVTVTNQTRVVVLTNGRVAPGATSTFSLSATVPIEFAYDTVSGVTASAWLGDFDGDGECDLVVPRRDLGGPAFMRRGDYANSPRPDLVSSYGLAAEAQNGVVQWLMNVDRSSKPAEANQVELIVYQTNDVAPTPVASSNGYSSISLAPQAVVRQQWTESFFSTPTSFAWSQPESTAIATFQFALLRYRNATKVWPPQLISLGYINGAQTPGNQRMNMWASSPDTGNWYHPLATPMLDVQNAAGAGTIKPPPPPPPPTPPTPPAPPDDNTGG